eukprot:5816616-Prymnesium_polylepis.1
MKELHPNRYVGGGAYALSISPYEGPRAHALAPVVQWAPHSHLLPRYEAPPLALRSFLQSRIWTSGSVHSNPASTACESWDEPRLEADLARLLSTYVFLELARTFRSIMPPGLSAASAAAA